MRDVDSRDVKFVQQDADCCRHYSMVKNNMKNDKLGTTPVAERTNLIPCICLDSLKSQKEKSAWVKKLMKNPMEKCCSGCPFAIMAKYLDRIPDPTGEAHEENQERASDLDPSYQRKPPLALCRALQYHGSLKKSFFGTCPAGVHTIRSALKRCNARLPENCQLPRATGHCARVTMCTLAVNNGAGAAETSLASHHRDINSCRSYVRPNATALMAAPRAIGSALHGNATTIAGMVLEEDEEDWE
jgi:hypothetical protein